jgi:hypothetical protein
MITVNTKLLNEYAKAFKQKHHAKIYNNDLYYFYKNQYRKKDLKDLFIKFANDNDWEIKMATKKTFMEVFLTRAGELVEKDTKLPIIIDTDTIFFNGKFEKIKDPVNVFCVNYIERKISALKIDDVKTDFLNAGKPRKNKNLILDFLYKLFDGNYELFMSFFSALAQPFIGKLSRFISLWGKGKNGKGTINKLVRATFGTNNVSIANLDQINNKVIAKALDNKLYNISNELSYRNFESEQIKNITTGEPFIIEEKYKGDERQINIKGVQIISSNKLLNTPDKTQALYDRIVPFKLKHHFKRDADGYRKENAMLKPRWLDYFASLVISYGIKIYKANDDIYMSELQKQELYDLQLTDDPIAQYINDYKPSADEDVLQIYTQLKDKGTGGLGTEYDIGNMSYKSFVKNLKEKGYEVKRINYRDAFNVFQTKRVLGEIIY